MKLSRFVTVVIVGAFVLAAAAAVVRMPRPLPPVAVGRRVGRQVGPAGPWTLRNARRSLPR